MVLLVLSQKWNSKSCFEYGGLKFYSNIDVSIQHFIASVFRFVPSFLSPILTNAQLVKVIERKKRKKLCLGQALPEKVVKV
jgi:hypothetical protein